MSRKYSLITISLIVFLALALFASGCGAVKSVQAFNQTGNDFMNALKDAKYEAAYALFHPELQKQIGQTADLQKMIEELIIYQRRQISIEDAIHECIRMATYEESEEGA